MIGDLLAELLVPDFGRSEEERAVRRYGKEMAAGQAVIPGLWLRPDAPALGGFIRVRPPSVWWRPGEKSAYGETAICANPDRILIRLPHAVEGRRGVPKQWLVLVLTANGSRSVLAIPKYFGRLLAEALATSEA